jgi:hypothetical protein
MGVVEKYQSEAIKLGLGIHYFTKIATSTRLRLEKEEGADLVEKFKNLQKKQSRVLKQFLKNVDKLKEEHLLAAYGRYLVDKGIFKNERQLFIQAERMAKRVAKENEKSNKLLKEEALEKLMTINDLISEFRKVIKIELERM